MRDWPQRHRGHREEQKERDETRRHEVTKWCSNVEKCFVSSCIRVSSFDFVLLLVLSSPCPLCLCGQFLSIRATARMRRTTQRAVSSVGQSASLTPKMSGVRVPYRPL